MKLVSSRPDIEESLHPAFLPPCLPVMRHVRSRTALVLGAVLITVFVLLSQHHTILKPINVGSQQPANRPTVPADWSPGSLRDRLLQAYKPDPESTGIPKDIWQSWKSKENLDKNFQENVRLWSAQQGFTHHFLDDEEVDSFVRSEFKQFPEIIAAWDILPRKILKADYFRYLILLANGGFYSDIDTSPTLELNQWLTEGPLASLMAANSFPKNNIGVIIGIEEEMDLATWRGLLNRRINLCQWTLASRKGHPLFVDIVAKIADLALHYYDSNTNVITFPMGYKNLFNMQPAYNMSEGSPNWYEGIIEWTGPASFTDSFFETTNMWYIENFKDHLQGTGDEVLCNSENVCIIDPNKPLNLVSKLNFYPIGDNLQGFKPHLHPIGWENLTLLEYPLLYGEVAFLPKHFFNSLYTTDDKKGYIHHAFTGTWKWSKDP